jgi:SAM-dependent methyltransferase
MELTSPESARYDTIGGGYAAFRREDPLLRAQIHRALGSARSVINVGAGSGSYEPDGRYVVAIEPSDVMAAQRPPDRVPAVRASADALPYRDDAFDAAMAILTVHHWDEKQAEGVAELRRVARGPVVLVTFDIAVCSDMWLMRDYLPEIAELDRRIFPPLDQLATWMGGEVSVEVMPIRADTPDWHLASYWAHPERVLDEDARNATSGFARMPPAVVDRAVSELARDLESGDWERRNGHLRALDECDVGMRLLVSAPGPG